MSHRFEGIVKKEKIDGWIKSYYKQIMLLHNNTDKKLNFSSHSLQYIWIFLFHLSKIDCKLMRIKWLIIHIYAIQEGNLNFFLFYFQNISHENGQDDDELETMDIRVFGRIKKLITFDI